eukprot:TRINITY_DN3833_c0_g1_i2.p7 TRINITY_DN3833_c0_g1~~TRINITY_DN3833_c0_g1_i2.p7  ORF type:complete len:118 (-),score=8.65 TRINITY_DN3833_c0_g1_i2:2128-2481(-)
MDAAEGRKGMGNGSKDAKHSQQQCFQKAASLYHVPREQLLTCRTPLNSLDRPSPLFPLAAVLLPAAAPAPAPAPSSPLPALSDEAAATSSAAAVCSAPTTVPCMAAAPLPPLTHATG